MALISERLLMPCFRQAASKPFIRGELNNDLSTIERPVSPVSTISTRRSVSSMKQLLPLKLQATPPQPKIDLASWLDSTVPNLQPLLASHIGNEPNEQLAAYSLIPCMSSLQDIRPASHRAPDRYKETALYSGPGSPMLSQAYFGDEEPCYHCSPKGSVYDELCIVSSYGDAEVSSPHSQGSTVDYVDTFGAGGNGSFDTSTISFAPSLISRSPTRCRKEYATPDEAAWMKSSLSSWIAPESQGATYGDGISEIHGEQNPFEGWLDSESSRSSSSFNSDEVLDVSTFIFNFALKEPVHETLLILQQALVTKLAPAKAHVIELTKFSQEYPTLTGPLVSNLQVRPATPYRLSRKRNRPINYPTLALTKKSFDAEKGKTGGHETAELISCSVPNLQRKQSMYRFPPSPTTSNSFGIFGEHVPENQYPDAESGILESNRTIINSIHDIVQGFPQQMLFLDTPCITDIRRQNHLARCSTDLPGFSDPSYISSNFSLPLDRLNSSTHRRRTATNYFAPFLRAKTRKSTLLRGKLATSYTGRPSSCMSRGWGSLASQPDIPPPKLSVFRHIFPDTQDWWRSVLYTHLVAFNYVRENHASQQRNSQYFPSKACRTLGISRGYSRREMLTTDANIRLAELEEALVSCITWITKCMAGSDNAEEDVWKTWNDHERDSILVRALAEIVKVYERGGGEGNVQQSH
jgi:hypothetical protein